MHGQDADPACLLLDLRDVCSICFSSSPDGLECFYKALSIVGPPVHVSRPWKFLQKQYSNLKRISES